jgi:hypothetical protein
MLSARFVPKLGLFKVSRRGERQIVVAASRKMSFTSPQVNRPWRHGELGWPVHAPCAVESTVTVAQAVFVISAIWQQESLITTVE